MHNPHTDFFRKYAYHCLHDNTTRPYHWVNGIIIFLVIFSIAVIPLHFLPNLEWAQPKLELFDKLTVTFFTFEYFFRAWSSRRPLQYIFSWYGIIDLFAILPFYLAKMGFFSAPEVFLILRTLRILKLGKVYEAERLSRYEEDKSCTEAFFSLIEGEKIERIVQKHSMTFLIRLVMPLVITTIGLTILVFFKSGTWAVAISILFFFLAFIFFLKAWLDFNYDVIYITNYRVILQRRELFGAVTNDVAYEAITNIRPSNLGIWHFLFGFGSITIETAAADAQLNFHEAPKPHEVVDQISSNRTRAIKEHEGPFNVKETLKKTKING